MTLCKRFLPIAASSVAAIACCSPEAGAAEGEGWDWVVAPYVWAPGISADVNTAVPPTGTDTDFSDIIDKIEGAFLLHAEGQGDAFGVFGDIVYLGLGDDKDHPRYRTESDLDARLFEAALLWSPGEDRFNGVDLFMGLRYIDVDLTIEVDPVNPSFNTAKIDASKSYSDFMIGARYTWQLGERWALTVRGDGSFGGTDGTWNAAATALYRTRHGQWAFGYRHMDIALEPRDTRAELILSGLTVGYGFRF
ncbi:hypothetical protein FZO89_06550 [Luteimonas viscosa]|uniref:Outer membrane protein beta-barrel domain-containing protein n=1 Tax=Luteimonas viscosa TaxID=1132694 RepID=A0A5D4XMZ7_9GAMM|nr:hypothetical protein [Luteimonas viscosa]TYT25939.1 hypothetical protein FZO89_06550 [Luteimonas viscosa]